MVKAAVFVRFFPMFLVLAMWHIGRPDRPSQAIKLGDGDEPQNPDPDEIGEKPEQEGGAEDGGVAEEEGVAPDEEEKNDEDQDGDDDEEGDEEEAEEGEQTSGPVEATEHVGGYGAGHGSPGYDPA